MVNNQKLFSLVHFLLILFFIQPNFSLACFMPPSEAKVSDKELVKRTEKIYYLETIGRSPLGTFEFRVLENLRNKETEVSLFEKFKRLFRFNANSESGLPNEFIIGVDQASDPFNRVQILPDCEMIPSFEVGKKYLGFLDRPYHFKSFEIVNSKDDKWYKQVKELIEQGN